MGKDKKSEVKKTLEEIKKLNDKADLERRLSVLKNGEEIWKLKNEQQGELLESQKEYLAESARIERERDLEEYRYRLNSAKTEAARQKIIYQKRREDLEREEDAYLDILKKKAREEEQILESVYKDAERRKNQTIADLEEIASQEAKFSKNLAPDSLLEELSITVGGEEYTREQLKDFSDDNKSLEEYKERMLKVSKRLKEGFGSDTEGYGEIIDTIRKSPKGEGGKLLIYMDMADDYELSEFIKGYRENKRLTEEIAGYSFIDEKEKIKEEIDKAWSELPEDFFLLGEESAKKYGEGFLENIRAVMESAKREIEVTFSGLTPTPAMLKFFDGVGNKTTNFYENINISGAVTDSARERIRAEHTYNMQKMMSGGY